MTVMRFVGSFLLLVSIGILWSITIHALLDPHSEQMASVLAIAGGFGIGWFGFPRLLRDKKDKAKGERPQD